MILLGREAGPNLRTDMYDFSIPMAVADYIPVLFFGMTMIILQWSLYNAMYKGAYALLASGTISVFLAGFLKATWKLLYASGVCDFYLLNSLFLPLQSIGFLLLGAGLLGMVFFKKRSDERAAMHRVMILFVSAFALLFIVSLFFALSRKTEGAPKEYRGTLIFISMMVGGLGVLCAVLSSIALKTKKPWLVVLFALSFFFSLAMGYLSSRDSHSAAINWIEESVNILSQGSLMIGSMILHKNGLSRVSFREEK